ncbi:tetratricopeptide repeat protein [Capnocytophaga sp. G2]|uniref:tetratricopeptide repeat protein n=1 Tax=Capnocytophaga sp. G2 TaxID=3110695 RepID=UPI002B49A8D9|nr:tetratricopeptide repeat protein [Capnocytophaga sp. G2]MEB3004321.1 tetratricopeptide repeat protein [Capnocytophaga sp. G2]
MNSKSNISSLQEAVNQIEEEKLLIQIKQLIQQENYVEAFPTLEKASILGNAEAMYILGELYFEGKYIEKDLSRAFEYYKQASEKKYPKALYELGMLYLRGEIVNKNIAKAEEFIKKSAKYGDKRALEILDRMGVNIMNISVESSQNDEEKYDIIQEKDTIESDKKGTLSNVFISTFLLAIVIFFVIFSLGIPFLSSNKVDSYGNNSIYLDHSKIREDAALIALVTTLIGTGIGFIGMLIVYFKPKISVINYVFFVFVAIWLPTFTIFYIKDGFSNKDDTMAFGGLTFIYLIVLTITNLFIKISKYKKPIIKF